MQDARTRGALIVLALVIFGGSGLALYATRRPSQPPVVITPAPEEDRPLAPNSGATAPGGGTGTDMAGASLTPPELGTGGRSSLTPNATPTQIYVHVAGAVKRPSLYALAPGSRVMQAVKAAGGPSPQADLDSINLAERVQDGEKVYVPRRQPPAMPPAMLVRPGNTLGQTSIMPAESRDSSPSPLSASPPAIETPAIETTGRSVGGGKGDKLTSPSQGQVDINTAGAAELQRLPGIGPAMAARILAYRQQAHGFHAIDDLQDVGGIGPKKFAKIAPFVTLN